MKEKSIQTKIMKFLKDEFDHVVVWKLSDAFNRGRPDVMAFFQSYSFGVVAFSRPHIVPVFIEVKRPGQPPTALQCKTLDELQTIGGHTLVASSVEDVAEFLETNGIGMRRARV